MSKFDVIIAGSGLGGLLCGYILSKEGYRVCILEKNKQIGGCLQNFSRDGRTFETGVHYLGSLGEGQILNQYFKYFGLLDRLVLKRLDIDCYDKISFENNEYSFAQGIENFSDTLISEFPQEKDGIVRYTKKIRDISNSLNLMTLREMNDDYYFLDTNRISASEYIESITSNRILRNVLAGTNPLYAGRKNRSPLHLHAIINHSFIESAWRIVGGSSRIAASLSKSIKSHGGTILNNSNVKLLITENGKITAAELSNGEKYFADYFISDINPVQTLKMIASNELSKAYRNRIEKIENTISSFTMYITLKEDSFPYINYNYYHYEIDDVWNGYDYTYKTWPPLILAITPVNKKSEKYANNLIAITYMHSSEVSKWQSTYLENRNSEYETFKQVKAQKILEILYRKFPDLEKNIISYYSSSPLTYRDYMGTVDGSMYGILHDATKPLETMISARTKIPNLFLTGQNTKFHGVLGVSISSIVTCSCFLGMNYLIEKVKNA